MAQHPAGPPAQLPPPPRVVIEHVEPEIDCGRHPIKRVVGERVVVTADAHTDGHDVVVAVLQYRPLDETAWREQRMEPLGNDRWRASFSVDALQPWVYTVEAWPDPFASWRRDLAKRVQAGAVARVDLLTGAGLLQAAAGRADGREAEALRRWSEELAAEGDALDLARRALSADLLDLAARHPDRRHATRYGKELRVLADRERARFSTWYELFPRSTAAEPGRHGTLADVHARLAYVAEMGFDVVYLPPVHPIGRTHRKGRNNAVAAQPGDVGSPWAIGGEEGGHKAIHPDLGTLDDFRRLVARAQELGLEIALDYALQCSPDHPYVKEHPEWFRHRPDGTIQYAENPPKKYQDVYPLDFETEHWRELWEELRSILLFWVGQGVRIFRVDNPHTKPYRFWEWVIAEVRKDHPEVIFLAEAFTRPRVMYQLAKLGFQQSYNYFPWRNTKPEIEDYFTELTRSEAREYLRPNLWPNTPDILTEALQHGGRAVFITRLVLAATLGASYGIYGPPYELMEATPREAGSEEYLDSEKYQVRHWDLETPYSLKELIARVNRIRREHPALQTNDHLAFHPIDNPQLVAYSKVSEDLEDVLVVVVSLDPHHKQSGWLELPPAALNLEPHHAYQAHDLLSDARFFWHGEKNYVELDPGRMPAHVLRIRRRLRTEREFDYYL